MNLLNLFWFDKLVFMMQLTDKFVIAKRDIEISSGVWVRKDDVGIIKWESGESATIFFIRLWQEVNLNKNDYEVFDVAKAGDGFPRKSAISAINFYPPQNSLKIKTV